MVSDGHGRTTIRLRKAASPHHGSSAHQRCAVYCCCHCTLCALLLRDRHAAPSLAAVLSAPQGPQFHSASPHPVYKLASGAVSQPSYTCDIAPTAHCHFSTSRSMRSGHHLTRALSSVEITGKHTVRKQALRRSTSTVSPACGHSAIDQDMLLIFCVLVLHHGQGRGADC